ncbi:MAG: type I phosphomannose isomerase catalytic subunit, partial [Planctomycetota bacterium]
MTPSQDQTPGESAPPTERTPAGVGGHSTVHPDDYLLGNWQPDGAPAPEPAPHATPAAPPAAAAPAPYATSSPPPASSSAPPVPLPTQPTGAADTARGPLPRPLIAAAVVAFVLAAWFAVEGIYVATNEELLATLMQNLAAQMPDQQPIEPSQLSFMLLMLYCTMTTLYAVAARRLLALSLGARFLLVILGWVNMALFIRFAMIDGHPFITWIDNLAAGVALIGLLSAPSVVRRFYSERVASMREMATAAATAAHQARQRHAAHMAHGASMQAQAQASSSATPGSQPAPPDPRHIAPYPLQLVPHLDVRPWGDGSHLRALGKQAPAGQSIGESWEVSGHPYAPSIVRNGPLAGRTLNEVMTAWGEWLLGPGRKPVPVRVGDTWEWRFPLLAKFLDTQSWLSVQVHPP